MTHDAHVWQVRDTIYSMTEPRAKDVDYTARQYAEVEWMVTGETEKVLPSLFMNLAMTLMFIGE